MDVGIPKQFDKRLGSETTKMQQVVVDSSRQKQLCGALPKLFFLFCFVFYTLFTCITSNILTYRHNLHNIYIVTYMTSYLHNTCHTYYTSLKEH